MGPASGEPRTEATAETAATWFVRLQDPDTGVDDWQAFEAWLAASPANAEAYDRLERLWVELDRHADALSGETRRSFASPIDGEPDGIVLKSRSKSH